MGICIVTSRASSVSAAAQVSAASRSGRRAGIRIPPWPPPSGSGVQLLIRHQSLQPAFSVSEVRQTLHHIPVHRPVLGAPAVQRHIGDRRALSQRFDSPATVWRPPPLDDWTVTLPIRTLHRRLLSAPGAAKVPCSKEDLFNAPPSGVLR